MKSTLRKSATLLLTATLLAAGPCAAQDRAYSPQAVEIETKIRKHEPVTKEEQAYFDQYKQQVKAEWSKAHPPRDSTGMIPLTDLGKGTYKGEQGGLYPHGENVPPAAHAQAGLRIARSIQPLDADGRPSKDGRIVMISIGISNTTIESQVFAKMVEGATGVNAKFLFVDCAQGGQVAGITADPKANYWKVAEERLRAAGVTPKQVQAAWVKTATANPVKEFPVEPKKLQSLLAGTVRNMQDNYPNLKIAYLSSRIYAGYAISGLNPEPHAYESGFAVKWLIADQIAGNPELSYDPAKGAVKAPWLAWGPYLWADGVKARSDGLTWLKDDFMASDRTHPAPQGREKVAGRLMEFLMKDATSAPWFAAGPAHSTR